MFSSAFSYRLENCRYHLPNASKDLDGIASMHAIVHPDEMRNCLIDGGHIRMREH